MGPRRHEIWLSNAPPNRVVCTSRLGVVYVPRRCVPASAAFRTWLGGPGLGILGGPGVPLANKVKSRLSELAEKLMWPTLEYMTGRGDAVFREEVVTLQVGEGLELALTVGIAPFRSIPSAKFFWSIYLTQQVPSFCAI